MKTIFFSFTYDDQRARETLSAVRGKLEPLGYQALSMEDITQRNEWSPSTTDAIKNTAMVIAFLNNRNPNVLFETGYAYGLGKHLVLVSDTSNLPFDLRTVPAIDARNGPTEIAFEILRQVSSLDSTTWPSKMEAPKDLRGMLKASDERPELFEMISRSDFEKAIEAEFISQGFRVDFPEGSHESGFDMRVRDIHNKSLLVEVKKLNPNSKVSISSVQQLLGAAHAYDDSAALLICTSDFTNSSRYFVVRQPSKVFLWSLQELKNFVARYSSSVKTQATLDSVIQPSSDIPPQR